MKTVVIIFLLLASALSVPAFGQMYQWKDKDGVTHFTDTPTDRKYTSPGYHPPNFETAGREDLDSLYRFLLNESSVGNKSVGGVACYLCAAQVVIMVYGSGLPVGKEFFEIMYGLRGSGRSVGGLVNKITHAGLLQGIVLPTSGPCLTATIHSK